MAANGRRLPLTSSFSASPLEKKGYQLGHFVRMHVLVKCFTARDHILDNTLLWQMGFDH